MIAEVSLQNRLEKEIGRKKPGTVLFPSDFLQLGSVTAVHMALSRLTEQKLLRRLGKGIYVKPKTDPLLGPILPSLDAVAQAVAENEQVIIRATGSQALNKLGLSTQVPTKVVYLTNGSRRRIQIGRGVITFKPTTPKKLAAKNEMVFLAIQALIELGPKGTDQRVVDILTEKLRAVPVNKIREDARHAPQAAGQTLLAIANKLAHRG